MKLSKEKVIALIQEQGISQNALAKKIGVSPGTLSNAINGIRGAGRVILAGLLRQFHSESVESLTVKDEG